MIGYTHHDHVFGEEKHGLDGERCLVVQEVLPPAIGDKLWKDHGYHVVVVAPFELVDVLTDGSDE